MKYNQLYYFISSIILLLICTSLTPVKSTNYLNDSKKSHALEGIEAHTGEYTFSQRRYFGQCNGDKFWDWDSTNFKLSISDAYISYNKTYSSSSNKIIRFEEKNNLLIFYCAAQYGSGINVYTLTEDKNLLNVHNVGYGDITEYKN
jgi:hypothetical protein